MPVYLNARDISPEYHCAYYDEKERNWVSDSDPDGISDFINSYDACAFE